MEKHLPRVKYSVQILNNFFSQVTLADCYVSVTKEVWIGVAGESEQFGRKKTKYRKKHGEFP